MWDKESPGTIYTSYTGPSYICFLRESFYKSFSAIDSERFAHEHGLSTPSTQTPMVSARPDIPAGSEVLRWIQSFTPSLATETK